MSAPKSSSLFALLLTTALVSTAPAAEAENGWVDLIPSQAPSGEIPGWGWFCEDAGVPPGQVWRLSPDGVLQCSGTPRGYLFTQRDYADFELRLEWRFPGDKAGRGGVLLRTTGPHRIWPKSLEAQINSPDAGDFWGLGGFRFEGPGDRLEIVRDADSGKLTHLSKVEAAEKPAGRWNTYEITVRGDEVVLVINGRRVNRATRCETLPGKICLTAEGDPIEFRNIRLRVLGDSQK
ncbi:MAG: DUF1080 domain-containing protein [Thermogutta sp.]|nr:DUF1080 domain-containing protein [Thermogutta sp.]